MRRWMKLLPVLFASPTLAQCPPSCPSGTIGVDVDFGRLFNAGLEQLELNVLLAAVLDADIPDDRKMELIAIIADVSFTGGLKAGQSETTFVTRQQVIEDILARVLMAYVGFRDPFSAVDTTYTNLTDQSQHVSLGIFMPNEPVVTGGYTARTYLAIDLFDANGDGAALMEPSFILGAMAENAAVTRNGLVLDLTPRVGTTIVGPTAQTVVFDTGPIAGTVPPGDEITDLFPSVKFQLSPGDRVRIRGFMGVFPDGAFQIDAVDAIEIAGILGPQTGCPADLTGSSDPGAGDFGVPDGDADGDDFFFYLDSFIVGDLAICDLTGSSDPNDAGFGSPDGDCDGDDFFFYLELFVQGCS
ncbi:MAG: GC-type dockerin domain-anchored protein [Phycisphaerales bacterium JB037]